MDSDRPKKTKTIRIRISEDEHRFLEALNEKFQPSPGVSETVRRIIDTWRLLQSFRAPFMRVATFQNEPTVSTDPKPYKLTFEDTVDFLQASGLTYWEGAPAFMVYSKTILDFLTMFEEFTDPYTAKMISYRVGYANGRLAYEMFKQSLREKKKTFNPRGTFELLPTVLAGLGWGRSHHQLNDDLSLLRWTFPYGTTLANALDDKSTEPVCSFIAGNLSAWSSGLLVRKVELSETKCLAKGDGYCLFEGKPQKLALPLSQPAVQTQPQRQETSTA